MKNTITLLTWFLFSPEKYHKFLYYVKIVGCEPKYAIELILKES